VLSPAEGGHGGQVFGLHEVFHVFVVAGSITHFVFTMRYVLPGT